MCALHNYELCEKLVGHPVACRLMPEDKECVSYMTLNLVQPKNILATLKRKDPKISQISSKCIIFDTKIIKC